VRRDDEEVVLKAEGNTWENVGEIAYGLSIVGGH
jgi:hypothetical protein